MHSVCVLLWVFSGACVCYIVAAHIAKKKTAGKHPGFQTGESSRLLRYDPSRGTRWAQEAGCNFWALWLSEEISASKAAGGGRVIVFASTSQSVEVRCCWRVCFLTSYCIKCCCEACLHSPLRMPRRRCLHHSGQRVSRGWKCGESACWSERTGQGGL